MRKVFTFGKIDYNHTGRRINALQVEINLEYKEVKGYDAPQPVFTAIGAVWNMPHTDWISGGQNLDEINKFIGGEKRFASIYKLWKKYHLNDMHSGTPEQEAAVKKYFKETGTRYDYSTAVRHLQDIKLYRVTYRGEPYLYGHGWLYQEIEAEDLAEINRLLSL